MCTMEYVYFSRPDRILMELIFIGEKTSWETICKRSKYEADIVTGVPDSSISAAIGFAEASGIPYEIGLIKNRYVGRTFIQPSQDLT